MIHLNVVFRVKSVNNFVICLFSAFFVILLLLFDAGEAHAQANPAAAAISSQTQQDQQLRTQLKQTEEMAKPTENPQAQLLVAKPLSPDMGDVNILGDVPTQPLFFVTVDCQAFYNSNVLYASSIADTFGAWQIITTPEIGFAPTIQDETYKMLSPGRIPLPVLHLCPSRTSQGNLRQHRSLRLEFRHSEPLRRFGVEGG